MKKLLIVSALLLTPFVQAMEPEATLTFNDCVGHTSGIQALSYSLDGTKILTGSNDGSAKIWKAETCELLHTLGIPAEEGKYSSTHIAEALFNPAGDRVATVARADAQVEATKKTGYAVDIWDANTGKRLRTIQVGDDFKKTIGSIGFNPRGDKLVTGTWDGTVEIWDVATGNLDKTLTGHTTNVVSVVFNPVDTNILLTASWDGTAKLWNAAEGRLLHTLSHEVPGLPVYVTSAVFNPAGDRILTTASHPDKTAGIWDMDGKRLHTLKHDGYVITGQFSPDGKKVVTGSHDKTARIWNTATGNLDHKFQHNGEVQSVMFNPSGTNVATASPDGARIWNSATGNLDHMLKLPDCRFAVYNPAGNKLATASGGYAAGSGVVKVWNVS